MKRFLLTTILTMVFTMPALGQCKVGTGYWSWAPESKVEVRIVSTDFAEAELPFLLAPLASWNSVSTATGSKVKFEFKGTTETPQYCRNCLTIKRGHVFDKSTRHLTELQTYGDARTRHINWATIVIDPRLTNPETLTNAVAHELGHSFGLLDCYSCKQKSSVMIQFRKVNVSNDMDGPTPCDVARVKAVYQKQIAVIRKVVDEGEEPVDDDTPIVVPRP